MRHVVLCVAFAFCAQPAMARDQGQFENSDPGRAAWFKSLTRPDKRPDKFGCCDQSDCKPVESDLRADGHYWAKLNDDIWVQVPNEKIETDPETIQKNPTGMAVACWMGKPGEGGYLYWYCFLPWETLL